MIYLLYGQKKKITKLYDRFYNCIIRKEVLLMTYVVTENCIKCKYTDCVEVCPVDCFLEGASFLVIDPEECIDCALCEPECPIDAICSEDDLPEEQQVFLKINEELSKTYTSITSKKESLKDAKEWEGKPNKRRFL